MGIKPTIINPDEDNRWDNFVSTHPHGLVYHHSEWGKVIKSTYNYQPFYIGLEQSETGELEGVVPFFLVDSKLTGKRLVSLPFTSYCEPLVPKAKLGDIITFARENLPDVDYLELKFLENNGNEYDNYKKQPSFVTHILKLDIVLEQLFKSFHNNCIRRCIKKAEKNNLIFRIAEQEDDLKKFYRLLTLVRKRHGLPPQPYAFYHSMWEHLKSQNLLIVPVIEYKGKIIAGAIILKFKDTFHYEYAASDPKFVKLCPNHLLIWEIIKIAYSEGAKHFDFGRSNLTNKSLIDFKERWQSKRKGIFHYYYPEKKRIETEKGGHREILNSINRFLPVWLLQIEGKVIYRHLG